MKTEELLHDLNAEQNASVTHRDGPLLIVAGAGTGKTTVITRRIAWLIAEGLAKPDEILALTFTEKAASEMVERIDRLLPLGYVDLWISTFHAFGERILQDHALEIGLNPGFKLLSQPEQWLFIRQHLFDFHLEYYRPLGNPTRFIYALVSHFSRAKDEDVTPEMYVKYADELAEKNAKLMAAEAHDDKKALLAEATQKTRELAHAYEAYQALMREEGNMDFGDLILYTLCLFRQRKAILEAYRKQFKYILVDEFQDTNYAQYQLVQLLAAPKNNLTVCGDDDQSIYKFRGAAVSNILGFKKDYIGAKDVVLTQNYRSTQPILDIAYDAIQLNNPDRLEAKLHISKRLTAQTEKLSTPTILYFKTEEDEAIGVAEKILEIKNQEKETDWNDIAILVRSNAQANAFLQVLDRRGIPYQFVASKGLYARPEVMDILAYLRLLNNPYDNASAFRVLSSSFFDFDMLDVVKIQATARKRNITLLDMLQEITSLDGVAPRSIESSKRLLELLETHAKLAKARGATQVVFQFISDVQALRQLTQHNELENQNKILNINEFLTRVKDFENASSDPSLKNFIDELGMLQEAGEDPAPANPQEGPDVVHIMTIHAAKGLEFEHVFLVNLVDQRFPTRRRQEAIPFPKDLIREALPEEEAHLQEERRLFYVGLTRARRGLYLTTSENGSGKRKKKPSVFLREVQKNFTLNPVVTYDPLQVPTSVVEQKIVQARLKLPKKFSYTQLAAFERCPRQYQYAHMLKIHAPGHHSHSYGKSLHKTLELFHKLLQEGKHPSEDELLQIFEEVWIGEWYDSKKHEEKQKEKGRATLRQYFADNAGRFIAPLFLEKEFNVKIGKYCFKGSIDRIDPVEGGVHIIDYKTGKLKKQKDVDKDEQLSLYALAAKRVLQLSPVKLSLYFLDEGVRIDTTRDDDFLTLFEREVEETMDSLHLSDFRPTPGRQCQFCDFLQICDAGLQQTNRGR